MGYSIDSAKWPTGIEVSQAVKNLVERFYLLLDDSSPSSGDTLADEVFASDGVAHFSPVPSRGSEEIRLSRRNAWDKITSRKHRVLKVYICGPDADDLLFTGHAEMEFKNGQRVASEYAGRIRVTRSQGENPKISHYQVWADMSAFVKALSQG
ncbi:hypothetical protein CEP52_005564 [Fusarium oligoseptatum]|uniref:SnoaL-like domain-containing protein n=1 Tax=Fusarium oligoseptatum TaxID=2604345 RepID=A0A428TXB7_9HYPO|nr:hypothetical protein CEP52_005564 [Fusarium oligoseptatum]